ncbi:N-acetyltransferase [Peribacillus sp. NPDC097295]|uniref:N-acetyltransferase n=1 Tax=Peribacillus sp. NPDC097295 TaxID=3364402 RepID=UPI0037F5C310
MEYKVERLLVNFKTLEEFKKFKEYGMQELSMLDDLEGNIIENDSQSPFYGIFYGDMLIARMSLYKKNAKFDRYFDKTKDFLVLWKLEVLPNHQKKGYGTALVDFAKSFNMPIKTNSRVHSQAFWEKMSFSTIPYEMDRDLGENPMIWTPFEKQDEIMETKE